MLISFLFSFAFASLLFTAICKASSDNHFAFLHLFFLGMVLQIDEKRREAKCKRIKDRSTHLNVEFQRIARRDKEAFFSDQCKEIEENNRIGKIRDLFKKIRDTKRTFHPKMGTIKDRNGMDLTEVEDIKKRWQEYTELYKKDLHNPDNHDGVITHLEPDIMIIWVMKIFFVQFFCVFLPPLLNTFYFC